ncbi:D-2-hydroxyacid dehydrogenase [Candidatus Latescibacterota bacterium]
MNDTPKIVILDGYTLNPGDLSWHELESLGSCVVYDRTSPAEVLSRSEGAEILLTNKTVLDRAIIEKLPSLKYIGVMATGYNVVDTGAAKEHGVIVTNVPEYATNSVAQMVFSLVLELTFHVGYHTETVRSGRWTNSIDFSYWDEPLVELEGLTMGIIGYGRIGRAVAKLALAFGMSVLVNNKQKTWDDPGITFVDLDMLFAGSDFVSLHCPLTLLSKEIVNAKSIALMKKTAFLINTGRGPLVNEHDLAEALNTEKIAGAGVDVLTTEPPSEDNPLLSAKNCYITPHFAWATQAARKRLMQTLVENVKAFMRVDPVNVVKM